MTGAEHYKEAERLAEQALMSRPVNDEWWQRYALVAQVHATLALASATLEIGGRP